MQTDSTGLSPGALLLIATGFIAIWGLNCYVSSLLSGWHLLSKRFRAPSEYLGTTISIRRFPFEVCMRYWADYSNILQIALEDDMVHLSVTFPFRIGHAPLCIPWNEVAVSRTKRLWRSYVVLTLGRQEQIPFRISEHMARKLGLPECMADPGPVAQLRSWHAPS